MSVGYFRQTFYNKSIVSIYLKYSEIVPISDYRFFGNRIFMGRNCFELWSECINLLNFGWPWKYFQSFNMLVLIIIVWDICKLINYKKYILVHLDQRFSIFLGPRPKFFSKNLSWPHSFTFTESIQIISKNKFILFYFLFTTL
jgi:hypothetical protein